MTLTPTAALIVSLVGPVIGALIALASSWLTQRSNRELKIIELREQAAHTIRKEKREVYLELLRANRASVQYATQLGYMALGQQWQIDLEAVGEASTRFRNVIPELELVASRPIFDLVQKLYVATASCQDTMYRESERRFAEFGRCNPNQEQPSPEQRAAIWEEVRAEVQKVYEEQGIEQLYRQLRNQIRQELGYLVLDPKLTPTAEETEKLRRELANRDQILRTRRIQPIE